MTEKRITCNNAIEAEAFRNVLMDAGIESMIYDETNSKVARGIINQTVDVVVKEEEYDRAQELYNAYLADQNNFMPWCPKCGSENVSRRKKQGPNARQLPRFLATLLMFIPFGNVTSQKFVCNDCGYRWVR